MMLEAGYADAYGAHPSGEGETFPVWDPHVRLDFAFVPEEFKDRIEDCECSATSRRTRRLRSLPAADGNDYHERETCEELSHGSQL